MMDYLLPIGIIILLVLLNGLFVAAEFAIVGARRTRVEQLAEEGSVVAQDINKTLSKPEHLDRYVAVAQVGITLASIGLGMYGEQSIAGWLYGPLERFGGLGYAASHTVGTIIAVGALTYLHVVFGEMIPKALALQAPEATAFRVYRPMVVISWIFYPAVVLLNAIGAGIMRLMRISTPSSHDQVYSPRELELLVSESYQQGVLKGEQQELIKNIFDFGEHKVYHFMTPRTQVVGLKIDSKPEDIWHVIESAQHSRMPVYEGDLDHIIGILHTRDFVQQQVTDAETFDLPALLRKVPYVSEHALAENVLATFKRLKTHLAVVVDEYGGTAGIVTLEDLLEEVVGEIQDEFDEEDPDVQTLEDGSLLVNGAVLLEDLNERYNLQLNSEEAETVAGLILRDLGHLPQVGDSVRTAGVNLTVEEVSGLAIRLVHVALTSGASSNES